MNTELFMVFVPGISWILFALGGTQISSKTPGWKGWRRFILPTVFGIALFLGGISIWWKILITMAITGAVYSLPYGNKVSWAMKALVGLGYGLITIAVGVSWWNLFTAIGFIALFKLSNTKLTADIFVWKICEGMFGLLCGIQLAYLLIHKGITW